MVVPRRNVCGERPAYLFSLTIRCQPSRRLFLLMRGCNVGIHSQSTRARPQARRAAVVRSSVAFALRRRHVLVLLPHSVARTGWSERPIGDENTGRLKKRKGKLLCHTVHTVYQRLVDHPVLRIEEGVCHFGRHRRRCGSIRRLFAGGEEE